MSSVLLAAFAFAFGCRGEAEGESVGARPASTEPSVPAIAAGSLELVGSRVCGSCHAAAFEAWQGSHHDLAMQEPSEQTVLGAFDGATVSYGDETFVFERAGGRYLVEVRAVDGTSSTYPVRYTFGVEPLQQYLVDIGGGRLQSLLVAWDARPAAMGGQRWYHLQGDDPAPPGDPLHWREPAYTWNSSCAACHSTGVDKGYDPQSRRYDTTFAEIDVGCEACHGKGSHHVAAARTGASTPMPFPLVKPDARAWMPQPDRPIARLEGADAHDPELDRCAPCHSRRSELPPAEGGMHDGYRLALLEDGLYFANGQIDGEVFVLGSFLQSKMYAAGVVCSDCHEPHGLRPRVQGNALCASCHRPEVFDTTEHHLHPPQSVGAQCVACHMPQRTYMQIDERADHRFGVPAPVLAAKVGAPDPCLGCHPTQTPEQAAEAIGARGPRRPGGFGEALLSARHDEAIAVELLLAVLADAEQPAIVRATALEELGRHPVPALAREVERASKDLDPLMRRTAAAASDALPPSLRQGILLALVGDPVRSVRVEAIAAWVGAGSERLAPAATPGFEVALADYARAQQGSTDRASGLTSLAALAKLEGDPERTRVLLEQATALEPAFLAAHVNLADLHRAAGREAEAEATLRNALELVEDRSAIHHALGLALIRSKRLSEALEQLEAAHVARPDVARYGYVHAIALFDTDHRDEALVVLQRVHERHPADLGVLETLVEYSAALGRSDDARRYRAMLRELQRASSSAPATRVE